MSRALLICSVVGIGLIAWARATADLVRIPAVHLPSFGLAATFAGVFILLLGLRGKLRLLPQPIYLGFSIATAGVSIAAGSASGLWLVSPIVALTCTALAFAERDPSAAVRILPEPGATPPTIEDRVRLYLFVLAPWLALYEVVLAIGIPPDAISGMLPFEQRLPVLEWTQVIYASTYFVAILAPLFAKTRDDLRAYASRGLGSILLTYPAFLLIPLIAPKRPFMPHTLPGRLLAWERTLDSPVAAFPSFHVIWAILAAEVYARRWPKLRAVFYGWAILVAASCITTSQHSILDVLGAAATVALIVFGPRLRASIAAGTAGIPARVFTAAAAFSGILLAETMAGASAGADVWLILAAIATGLSLAHAIGNRAITGAAIAAILARLWFLAAPLHLIAGLSLILAGIAKLAASPRQKTPGATILAGILVTALARSAPAPKLHFTWIALLPAALFALALASGLDFSPRNRRIPVLESVLKRQIAERAKSFFAST